MSCSHTGFDPNAFAKGAGFAIGGALISAAMSGRAMAQAHADAAATDDALQSWENLVMQLANEKDTLRDQVDTLMAALRRQQQQAAQVEAELYTARARLRKAGL